MLAISSGRGQPARVDSFLEKIWNAGQYVVNVVLHMLSHITPIREFFLQPELYATAASDSKLLRDTGLVSHLFPSISNL